MASIQDGLIFIAGGAGREGEGWGAKSRLASQPTPITIQGSEREICGVDYILFIITPDWLHACIQQTTTHFMSQAGCLQPIERMYRSAVGIAHSLK
jgi:hypothetical protein